MVEEVTNKPMLSVELMPCPMCLGKVRDPVAKHIGHGDFCFLVSCNCGLSFDGGQDLESAIRTWNRRAKPSAQHQGEPIKLSDDVREFLQEWIDSSTGGEDEDIDYDFANQLGVLLSPLYAEQPAPVAVVMTDDQILDAMREHITSADGGYVFDTAPQDVVAAGRALLGVARLNGVKP